MNEKEDTPTQDDDQAFDQLWDETAEDDALDSGEPASEPAETETPDPETPDPEATPAEPAEPEADNSELEKLKHKLSSAEGRFVKFEEHIEQLKTQISQREQPEPEPEIPPEADLILPDNWTKEDWDDFAEDNPVQAELLQNQTRQVQQLRENVETSEQQRLQKEQSDRFKTEIMSVHPDYEELLSNKRDDIVNFINSTESPLLKSAYQNTYERGSASDIVSLVSDYKAARAPKTNGKVSDRRLDDALAVPSRPATPRSDGRAGVPDKDDYDGAWDYFPDDSID